MVGMERDNCRFIKRQVGPPTFNCDLGNQKLLTMLI